MRRFTSKLLRVSAEGSHALEPVVFAGRVQELCLEKWIVAAPDLVGEPLLVIGRQLAEFTEDKDRLDVLAVDEAGELVLMELKATDDFRVTDLQQERGLSTSRNSMTSGQRSARCRA
jgi:RecB family endonuclease NucS